MMTFAIHGYEGVNPAREFERRGFPCRIFRSTRLRPFRSSPNLPTKMRNRDEAEVTVEATKAQISHGRVEDSDVLVMGEKLNETVL